MTLTLIDYFIIFFAIGLSIVLTGFIWGSNYGTKSTIVTGLVSVIVIIGLVFGLNWYNTSTASGIRKVKDYQSELSNGLDREIIITSEDGREIFYYEGKVDVETDHQDNYIKFETEDGKRYIIYYGIQDTVIILEK